MKDKEKIKELRDIIKRKDKDFMYISNCQCDPVVQAKLGLSIKESKS